MDRTTAPMAVCRRCIRQALINTESRRWLSSTQVRANADEQTSAAPSTDTPNTLDPNTVSNRQQEEQLMKESKRTPIASRRRRALVGQMGGSSISFEQMPYQCFQEARKVLQEDRKEKLAEIEVRRARIERLKAQNTAPQNERLREIKLKSMRKALEELKIYADINDPLVKKKFEDGQGDLSKPIYRFLADRKWREYKRKILMQRIEQMNVVPDVLPEVDPVWSTEMSFGGRKVNHGEIVNCGITEQPSRIKIQPFDQGTRLVTIAVVNPDVPNVAKDAFDFRCHFLAANIPVSPTSTGIDLARLDPDTQVLQSWLPPYAQNGLGYQRLAVCVFEQPPQADSASPDADTSTRSQTLDVAAIKSAGKDTKRDNWTARALVSRHRLRPMAIDLFRTQYDNNTEAVMKRAGIVGGDVEFKRKRIDPLPYKRMSSRRYR
ncbi:hypothetical protein AMS68_000503 [Peltaster fructicola]|uniref:PEBP-like protein n=1 Tax=Peltaster fructicola TaxID=286661 RepID=A0A6H0XJU5_9PEZI|nr:hypothetical protein AMS68_000503 [Peltaster fructicola]